MISIAITRTVILFTLVIAIIILTTQKLPNTELVVAVCTEDLSWIQSEASNYEKVTVYNKCDKELYIQAPNVSIQNISNVGSCDNAFLTYIIDRYDTLPEMVSFTKGRTHPDAKRIVHCDECPETDKLKLLDFHIDNWMFTNNQTQAFRFVKSPHSNMKEWVQYDTLLTTQMFDKTSCNTRYGGHFTASRKQIHNMPLEVYKNLKQQQKHTNEEIDHFIERCWATMFCSE